MYFNLTDPINKCLYREVVKVMFQKPMVRQRGLIDTSLFHIAVEFQMVFVGYSSVVSGKLLANFATYIVFQDVRSELNSTAVSTLILYPRLLALKLCF